MTKPRAIWWTALFLVPAVIAGYGALMLWHADGSGRWIFAVFAAFFLIMAVSPLLPTRRARESEDNSPSTRFAGAWVLPFYLLLFFGLMTLVILASVFHHGGK